MRGERRFLPVGRQHAQAAIVVMSVALDVRDAEQRHHREILQQGDRAEGAEILAGQDRRRAGRRFCSRRRRAALAMPFTMPLQFLWLAPA